MYGFSQSAGLTVLIASCKDSIFLQQWVRLIVGLSGDIPRMANAIFKVHMKIAHEKCV